MKSCDKRKTHVSQSVQIMWQDRNIKLFEKYIMTGPVFRVPFLFRLSLSNQENQYSENCHASIAVWTEEMLCCLATLGNIVGSVHLGDKVETAMQKGPIRNKLVISKQKQMVQLEAKWVNIRCL